MLYSMTGYGRGAAHSGELRIQVQLRTVNHRGLDVRCAMPPALAHLELEALRQLREGIGRGRVEARVDLEGHAGAAPRIDAAVAREVHRRLEEVRAALGLDEPVGLELVLRAPGVWTTREAAVSEEAAALLAAALSEALAELTCSRAREGEGLRADLTARLAVVARGLEAARERAPLRVSEYESRIAARVAELSAELAASVAQGDDGWLQSRIATEVALLADRVDIGEELQRADVHVAELGRLLESEAGPLEQVGKRIDFFLQELGRELNTMGAKSRDAELTGIIIEMKTELESMREQTANVQ